MGWQDERLEWWRKKRCDGKARRMKEQTSQIVKRWFCVCTRVVVYKTTGFRLADLIAKSERRNADWRMWFNHLLCSLMGLFTSKCNHYVLTTMFLERRVMFQSKKNLSQVQKLLKRLMRLDMWHHWCKFMSNLNLWAYRHLDCTIKVVCCVCVYVCVFSLSYFVLSLLLKNPPPTTLQWVWVNFRFWGKLPLKEKHKAKVGWSHWNFKYTHTHTIRACARM